MATDPQNPIVPPSQTAGGDTPYAEDVAPNGDLTGQTAEGIVTADQDMSPAEQDVADALSADPSAGDGADATKAGSDEPPRRAPVDPAVRDAAMNPMQAVRDYAKSKAVR
jgi:hypothetical protein